MTINTGLSSDARNRVIQVLDRLLADETVLHAKTRRFHWHVTGPLFSQLHALFEAQYDELGEILDEVAERTRQLDGFPAATLTEALAAARLTDAASRRPDANGMVAELLADHETVARGLREALPEVGDGAGDAGTEDFLTGLMQRHEKMAWFLRSHVG